jgi:3-hydroxyisobutyrate dehydrogenase/2-hydroxy-3-oxopropionate reductase
MGTVSVVGAGAMGSRIALRLLDAGYEVLVWNRSPGKLAPLLARGALAVPTPGEAASRSQTLITMLAGPQALRSVSEGPDGIAAGHHPGLTVVEMSTVGPPAVRQLASLLGPQARLVDAPVLGSTGEAGTGTLTIFAGGPAAVVDEVEPLLAVLGTVVRAGPLGAGAAAKLVANAALFGTLAAFGETLALAGALELPWDISTAVLAFTPLAGQARRRLSTIEAGDYPRRFALALARKDADLILRSSRAAGVELPGLAAARGWLAAAETEGRGDDDYTAMLATILHKPSAAGEDYDGLIVDLDGVIWLSGHPIDGAAETIRRLRERGVRILFLTNDPEHSSADQARHLTEIGIPATAGDVLTASAAAAAFLAAQERLAGARTLVIGPQALRDELAAAGFCLVTPPEADTAAIVVVAGHDRFDYGELRTTMLAVGAGAELFATGRDGFVPAPGGREPGTGAILAAIETATGATATITGKPEPHMFATARDLLAGCARVAVVGDSLTSDVAGAKRAGLDAILVLSGVASADDLERAVLLPDVVLPTVAALG